MNHNKSHISKKLYSKNRSLALIPPKTRRRYTHASLDKINTTSDKPIVIVLRFIGITYNINHPTFHIPIKIMWDACRSSYNFEIHGSNFRFVVVVVVVGSIDLKTVDDNQMKMIMRHII